MKEKLLPLCACMAALSLFGETSAQVNSQPLTIAIDTDGDNLPISPYLYGRNGMPTDDEIDLIREAGIQFERMNNGNNLTKYNWRKKLTCHPDWYNNVYDCDWDQPALTVQEKLPNLQGMFGFQLLGKVAGSKEYNFNDWEYNNSQWWTGCQQPMCGGGQFTDDGKVEKLGNTSLFLDDWPADSTVGILNHWKNDLNIDLDQYRYWAMDNEMEIWGSTHKDVYPTTYNDEVFEDMMQKYFAVAKAARKVNPDIKLCGPNAGNEWTWYSACGAQPTYNGKKYSWLEYFIMRCAEEEKKSGVRMLDVLDLHFYPGDKTDSLMLQTHRVFFDKDFTYSGANGVKTINGGWNNEIQKEYIFERCKEWIVKYFGSDNGITFGVGEYNLPGEGKEMTHAIGLASNYGEGARHKMEYFCPWTWHNSMWEVAHLFSKTAKSINVQATSSDENLVSAYTSKNTEGDSLTIILVNRSQFSSFAPNISIQHSIFNNGDYDAFILADLGDNRTFNSDTDNQLKTSKVTLHDNQINNVLLAPMSITSIVLHDGIAAVNDLNNDFDENNPSLTVYPNPTKDVLNITDKQLIQKVEIISPDGAVVNTFTVNACHATINVSNLNGLYLIRTYGENNVKTSKVSIQ